MADTLVMVGTRKGLWIGRSDEARRDWSWTGPHFAMEEVYSCLVDTRGDRPRLLAGASSSWLGPAGLALRRPRRDLAGDAQRRRPLPRGHRRGRRPRLAADARRRGRRRVRRHRARRDLQVRPTAARPSSSSAGCGTTRSARSGTPASAARPSTRSCPTPRSPQKVLAAISTGGVYRTDDGGDSWYPSNTGVKAEFMPGERSLPRVRPVRAQGDPPPRAPRTCSTCRTTVASTAPRTAATPGRTSRPACRRSSASRSSSTRTTPRPSTPSRSSTPAPAGRSTGTPASGGRPTRGRHW